MAPRKLNGKEKNAVMNIEEEYKQAARNQSQAPKASAATREFISLKGGVMTIGETKIKGGTLDVLILDFAYVNSFYEKPYNPKEPSMPSCYAIGRSNDELAPHAEAEEPVNQACQGCPNNEFGSRGDGSKGKACKNNIRLSLVAAGDLEKPADKWRVVYMNIPATSIKAFSNFYKENCCDETGDVVRPTYAFVTNIAVEPDSDTMFRLFFDITGDKLSREQFYTVRDKIASLKDDVLFGFPKLEELEKPTARDKTTKPKNKKY